MNSESNLGDQTQQFKYVSEIELSEMLSNVQKQRQKIKEKQELNEFLIRKKQKEFGICVIKSNSDKYNEKSDDYFSSVPCTPFVNNSSVINSKKIMRRIDSQNLDAITPLENVTSIELSEFTSDLDGLDSNKKLNKDITNFQNKISTTISKKPYQPLVLNESIVRKLEFSLNKICESLHDLSFYLNEFNITDIFNNDHYIDPDTVHAKSVAFLKTFTRNYIYEIQHQILSLNRNIEQSTTDTIKVQNIIQQLNKLLLKIPQSLMMIQKQCTTSFIEGIPNQISDFITSLNKIGECIIKFTSTCSILNKCNELEYNVELLKNSIDDFNKHLNDNKLYSSINYPLKSNNNLNKVSKKVKKKINDKLITGKNNMKDPLWMYGNKVTENLWKKKAEQLAKEKFGKPKIIKQNEKIKKTTSVVVKQLETEGRKKTNINKTNNGTQSKKHLLPIRKCSENGLGRENNYRKNVKAISDDQVRTMMEVILPEQEADELNHKIDYKNEKEILSTININEDKIRNLLEKVVSKVCNEITNTKYIKKDSTSTKSINRRNNFNNISNNNKLVEIIYDGESEPEESYKKEKSKLNLSKADTSILLDYKKYLNVYRSSDELASIYDNESSKLIARVSDDITNCILAEVINELEAKFLLTKIFEIEMGTRK